MRCPLLSGAFFRGKHPSVRWNSSPLTAANGRVLEILTGTVLGGASRFNAMLYTRGSAAQYDQWRRQGRVGWSYDDLEPYFIKSENAVSTSGAHHGHAGQFFNQFTKNLHAHTDLQDHGTTNISTDSTSIQSLGILLLYPFNWKVIVLPVL